MPDSLLGSFDRFESFVFISVAVALLAGAYGERWRARSARQAWRARNGAGHAGRGDRGRFRLSRPASPATRNATDQLQHVMHARFEKRPLLSRAEARTFFAVETALERTRTRWRVMAQVNLGEILASDDEQAFMAINSKRVDMLIIGANGLPVAAIEYQGEGHHQGTSAARDAVKKEALRRAGVGFFEVTPHDNAEDIDRLVMRIVDVEKLKSAPPR